MYSLVNEYRELMERRQKIEGTLCQFPKGYISRKTINGKQYFYLQNRVDGKITSEYMKTETLETVNKQLARRKEYEAEIPKIELRLRELEQAAKLIGGGMDRSLMLLKISSGMDELEQEQKIRSVSFANAMNAVEGVSVSEQTAAEIACWQRGDKSYQAVFAATLRRYGFSVEV